MRTIVFGVCYSGIELLVHFIFLGWTSMGVIWYQHIRHPPSFLSEYSSMGGLVVFLIDLWSWHTVNPSVTAQCLTNLPFGKRDLHWQCMVAVTHGSRIRSANRIVNWVASPSLNTSIFLLRLRKTFLSEHDITVITDQNKLSMRHDYWCELIKRSRQVTQPCYNVDV